MKTADLGLDTSSLYEAISRERRRLGMSRLAVMKEVGTVSSTLTRLGMGYPPKAVTLLRICAWLGRDARDFIKREDEPMTQIDGAPGPGTTVVSLDMSESFAGDSRGPAANQGSGLATRGTPGQARRCLAHGSDFGRGSTGGRLGGTGSSPCPSPASP